MQWDVGRQEYGGSLEGWEACVGSCRFGGGVWGVLSVVMVVEPFHSAELCPTSVEKCPISTSRGCKLHPLGRAIPPQSNICSMMSTKLDPGENIRLQYSHD